MSKRSISSFIAIWLLVSISAFGEDKVEKNVQPTPLELFDQRIMPIFRSAQPASCVQCHLAAVDLKDYILPSHEQTFASLRDQGLIDLTAPEKSKILGLIQMGEKDRDKESVLLHAETRMAEYEAFAAWINACCNDPRLRDLQLEADNQPARPDRPDAVIRHARKSRLVDSFARNVWSQRMRCFPCHTPHEIDGNNPKHVVATQRHEDYVGQFGDRMQIFRATPEATLQAWIDKSQNTPEDELPLLNLKDPAKSLIVLKPTAKLPAKTANGGLGSPSYVEPVSHMGGLKMHVDDPSYKAFIAWIRDYGNVVGDRYAAVDDLPADNWYASQHVLMLQDTPKAWPELARVQLLVHDWDKESGTWHQEPVAFTQNSVTPRNIVVGSLFLIRSPHVESTIDWNAASVMLPAGKYLIKVYVDTHHRLTADPAVMLGADDFYGQLEIEAQWKNGFPAAQKISGSLLK